MDVAIYVRRVAGGPIPHGHVGFARFVRGLGIGLFRPRDELCACQRRLRPISSPPRLPLKFPFRRTPPAAATRITSLRWRTPQEHATLTAVIPTSSMTRATPRKLAPVRNHILAGDALYCL